MLRGVLVGSEASPPVYRERRFWLCVEDPSGLFLGRRFRGLDLLDGGGFPPGCVFINEKTGMVRRVAVNRIYTERR